MAKFYWDEVEVQKLLKVSKGRGILDKKLIVYFTRLVNEFVNSQTEFDITIIDDLKQEALLRLLSSWHLYDDRKYNITLPFFTEIVKRNLWQSKKQLKFGKKDVKDYKDIKFLSIDKIFEKNETQ